MRRPWFRNKTKFVAILFNFVQRRHTWRSSAPHLSFNLRSTLLRFESSMFEPRIFDTCLPFRYPDVLLLSRLVSRDPASKRLFLLSFFLHYFNRFFLILVFPFKGWPDFVPFRLPFYARVCIIDDKHNKFAISRYKSCGRRIISHSTNSFNSVLCMCMSIVFFFFFFVRGWYKVVQDDWKFGWLKRHCWKINIT